MTRIRRIKTVKFGTETITYISSQVWNSIPENINAASLEIFRKQTKDWESEACLCRICKNDLRKIGFI